MGASHVELVPRLTQLLVDAAEFDASFDATGMKGAARKTTRRARCRFRRSASSEVVTQVPGASCRTDPAGAP